MQGADPEAARPRGPAAPPPLDYLRCRRQILLDMHVPDWDDRFLAGYDVRTMVDLFVRAGADAVMTFCNSHAGLCYWPTKLGREHRATAGRDLVGETVQLLHDAGIAACAYYSSNFNNWAYTAHPSWRIEPLAAGSFFGEGSRYGICCPNNPRYHEFQLGQVAELASTYPFDGFFFDMVFWTDICGCEHCRGRYREEADAELPGTIDWFSPEWCRFQTARERWLAERFAELRSEVKRHRDVPVFFNAAANVSAGWQRGVSDELVDHADLLSGDYHGDAEGLYAYGHLLARRTPTVMQYMSAFSAYVGSTSYLKSADEQIVQHALPAAVLGGQYLAIDAIEPDGTTNDAAYDRLAEVFEALGSAGSAVGGKPIADVAVYWSFPSLVDFRENGTSVSEHFLGYGAAKPHRDAVIGACSALRTTLPVGVISRADLADLARYPVIVLPNVLRTDDEELEAFREYVASGGSIYASGYTSLVSVDGVKRPDFGLADVFGCHFEGEDAPICYARPRDDRVREAILPLRQLPYGRDDRHGIHPRFPGTAVRVRGDADAVARATVTLPYASGLGTRDDEKWASIHGSPPWEETDRPAILEHRYGRGTVIYCAGDLEVGAGSPNNDAARSLFVSLVSSLLPAPPRFELAADPGVWAAAFDDDEQKRMRLNLSNQPGLLPARPVPSVRFRLTPPAGRRFSSLGHRPRDEALEYRVDGAGVVEGEIRGLRAFVTLEARYE